MEKDFGKIMSLAISFSILKSEQECHDQLIFHSQIQTFTYLLKYFKA